MIKNIKGSSEIKNKIGLDKIDSIISKINKNIKKDLYKDYSEDSINKIKKELLNIKELKNINNNKISENVGNKLSGINKIIESMNGTSSNKIDDSELSKRVKNIEKILLNTNSDLKTNKDSSFIKIGNIKFYLSGKRIFQFTIGKDMYTMKTIDSSKLLKSLWSYSNRQKALSFLYAFAKKLDQLKKKKEFKIDLFSDEFIKSCEYFEDNCSFLSFKNTTKIKKTKKNSRYNSILNSLDSFLKENSINIEIINNDYSANEKFTKKGTKWITIKIKKY